MRKLIMYLRANKKKILTIIAVLASIIFIVHFMNAVIVNNYQREKSENSISNLPSREETGPTESIIDDSKISVQTAQENTQIIKQFVEYCNQKDYKNAFSVLSSDCQREVFNDDINLFIKDYCTKIFQNNKTYDTELWTAGNRSYTYQIKYYDNNLLATGGNSKSKNIEDYITVVDEYGNNRLNINSFILYEKINRTINKDNIEITINSRKIYKTYEKYNLTIKNGLSNTISISTNKSENDICLVDRNGTQYISLLYEIPQHLLNIQPGYQTNIDIRFNKTYNNYRLVDKMRFNSIVLNYEQYVNNPNNEIKKIAIDISL